MNGEGWLSSGEVREQLQAARAFVLPSLAENLPSAIMEAFAVGRPAISNYVGGIPELVQAGVSGWLVPAGSVEPLTAAMREALLAPTERLERMAQAGARRLMDWHAAGNQAQALRHLLEVAESTTGANAANAVSPITELASSSVAEPEGRA